jgi:hypothetical protein
VPNYTYTCDRGHLVQIFHSGAAPIRSKCEFPECSAPARIKIGLPQIVISRSLKVDREYREDLARFPGDKRAFVDGPKATQKLISQTKRELDKTGGKIRSIEDAAAGLGKDPLAEVENAPLLEEAYDEALEGLEEE